MLSPSASYTVATGSTALAYYCCVDDTKTPAVSFLTTADMTDCWSSLPSAAFCDARRRLVMASFSLAKSAYLLLCPELLLMNSESRRPLLLLLLVIDPVDMARVFLTIDRILVSSSSPPPNVSPSSSSLSPDVVAAISSSSLSSSLLP